MADLANSFKFKLEEYKRNIDPIKHYMKIASFVRDKLKQTNNSREVIKEYIKSNKKYQNPTVYFRERDLDGNISMKKESLKSYLDNVKKEGNIMVPSGTVYFPPNKKLSLHSEFTMVNKKERDVHKKQAFKYKMEKTKTK